MRDRDGLHYPGQNLPNVVGNGRLIATARAGSVAFAFAGAARHLRLLQDGQPIDDAPVDSFFYPGGAVFTVPGSVRITHAAPPDALLYVVALENLADRTGPWTVEVDAEVTTATTDGLETGTGCIQLRGGVGRPEVDAEAGLLTFALKPGARAYIVLGGREDVDALGNPSTALAAWRTHYRARGLQLRTPEPLLDLGVDFMKYHLQLGYDWRPEGEEGGKMVCDIFRWRDVWSRDFGSGFGPGAIVAGMTEATLRTLDYEVQRYERAPVDGWKVSDDTSQGGSIESLGWLMKLVWRTYKHTGDEAFLRRMVEAFTPWMDAWIDRDADEDGLVVDVTEWMDHSRFLRLPEGQRTLYSNVLYYAALRRFRHAHAALGAPAEAERFQALASLTRKAIHEAFWNEAGYFNNAVAWGVTDTALMLADNAIALNEGIASRNERFRTLETIRERNWRAHGSVTCDLPMKYVPTGNDHNVKVWPWWMAHEAKARFLNYDAEGGLSVLRHILATLTRPTFPGLCEEYLDPDDGSQDEVVGHAFITGAGATLDAIQYGLVGLSHRGVGERALRLAPQVPRHWTDWEASLQLVQGRLRVQQTPDAYRIVVSDARVESLELRIPPRQGVALITLDGAGIEPERFEDGASEFLVFRLVPGGTQTIEVDFAPRRVQVGEFSRPNDLPEPLTGVRPALMDEPRLFADVLQGFVVNAVSYFGELRHVGAQDIEQLATDDLLVVVGNEMPYLTKRGASVTAALDAHLDRGGAMLLLGPRFGPIDLERHYHGGAQMGGKAGMFWWKAWQDGHWVDFDPRDQAATEAPAHHGTVYWGDGPLFAAWEHGHGLFGFETACRGLFDANGVAVDGDQRVDIVYTDWTVRKPWSFHPLAFTERLDPLVTGPRAERYPCAALLANRVTGARIVVVAPALCSRADLLHRILGHVVTAGR